MRILGLDTSTLTASVAVVEVVEADADGERGWRVLAEAHSGVRSHSAELLTLIDGCLRESALTLADVDGIAIGAGPGSFTGLRIGMATAKGLAFAADKPLWAVSSLAALALGLDVEIDVEIDVDAGDGDGPSDGANAAIARARAGEALVAAVMDARRGEIFVGVFRLRDGAALPVHADAADGERVLAPEALASHLAAVRAAADGAPVVAVGDAFAIPRYRDALAAALSDDVVAVTDPRLATPRAASVARLAWLGACDDSLARGAPVYIRPAEVEIKFPDGNPGGTFSPPA